MNSTFKSHPIALSAGIFSVLVLYLLSVGPVITHYHHLGTEPPKWVQACYTPAQWISAHCPPLSKFYMMYFEWLEQFV